MTYSYLTFREVVKISCIACLAIGIIGYILFQARFLIAGPQIQLTTATSFLQNERIVTLHGSAQNISRLWLNGRQMFTDPQGEFAMDVVLQNGYTIATIEAEDRYGRRTIVQREFYYAPMSFKQNKATTARATSNDV